MCPAGKSLLWNTKVLYEKDNYYNQIAKSKEYCIYYICPFIPFECQNRCKFVESHFRELIQRFIKNGAHKDQIDDSTILMIRGFKRVAVDIIVQMSNSDGDLQKHLEDVFISRNMYNGVKSFIINAVRLVSEDELNAFLQFKRKYPYLDVDYYRDF